MQNTINKQEVLRYIGAASTDERLESMITRAEREVIAMARPKHVYRHIPIQSFPDAGHVMLAGHRVNSKDISGHLKSCEEGFLFACTLGPGIDQLVKRYGITDVPMLPVVQAVAAAYTELCADEAQREIEDIAQRKGLYLRPRYSPGYGDFELSCQRFVFDALEIPKKIGVSLTDSFLMVPFKSITAVIGMSSDPSLCHINKCMTCTAQNCPFRKDS